MMNQCLVVGSAARRDRPSAPRRGSSSAARDSGRFFGRIAVLRASNSRSGVMFVFVALSAVYFVKRVEQLADHACWMIVSTTAKYAANANTATITTTVVASHLLPGRPGDAPHFELRMSFEILTGCCSMPAVLLLPY